jgi:N utilization substance protein B
VQILFERDLNPTRPLEKVLEEFWQASEDNVYDQNGFWAQAVDTRALPRPTQKMVRFTEKVVHGVEEHAEDINQRLQAYAEHWDIGRMGAVDRNAIRVALYEMFWCDDIPPVVSINEAVDVAKELSSKESGRFVNGILDRALKDIKRPSRKGNKPKEKPNG